MCHIKQMERIFFYSGVFLIVFIGFGYCFDSSSFSSKVDTSKYIMKSYYEKYESLDDSEYKKFVAQELPFGLCDTLPDSLSLVPRLFASERKLVGEGSHRRISSSLKIRVGVKSVTELSQFSCGVIVIERLPLGVFADPFELQHLLQRGAYSDIAVFGDTNLESPSFLSNRTVVEIHMNDSLEFSRHDNDVDIQLDLPLHARYAPLNETGYSQVRFNAPDLFLRCSFKEKLGSQICLYTIQNNDSNELQSGDIVWKIPCGINSHSKDVYVFTFFSASLAALLIILTSLRHPSASRCNSLKRS